MKELFRKSVVLMMVSGMVQLWAATVSAEAPAIAERVGRMLDGPHDANALLVRFKENVGEADRQGLHGDAGGVEVTRFRGVSGLTWVDVAGGDLERALTKYLASAHVRYAEPDFPRRGDNTPNDPDLPLMWGMPNIRAEQAWDAWTGDENFRIAVNDSGIDYSHPDIAANMWANLPELNGQQFVDDDANGYIDDIYGDDMFWGGAITTRWTTTDTGRTWPGPSGRWATTASAWSGSTGAVSSLP